jgi:hypothetical protein
VMAHDPSRRYFTLLRHSNLWSSSVIANIAAAAAPKAAHEPSCPPAPMMSWTSRHVDVLRSRWQLAVFLGVPACVFPPLPTRTPYNDREDATTHEDNVPLPFDQIADFLLDCVAGAASASSRETQCWIPFALHERGNAPSEYAQWREFCAALSRRATCSSRFGGVHHTTKRPDPLSYLIRPILDVDADCGDMMIPQRESFLWLGEDVAAILLAPTTGSCGDLRHSGAAPAHPRNGETQAPLFSVPLFSVWGGIAPSQCAVTTLTPNDTTMATLLSNLVGRGSIPFAAAASRSEFHVARNFSSTSLQLEHSWNRVCAHDRQALDNDGDGDSVGQLSSQLGARARAMRGLEDQLQVPLQPLADHLDGGVYQTFEQDRPKYQQYYRALRAYLLDCKQECDIDARTSGDNGCCEVTVLVLGAGRGPLVTECLLAATDVDVRVDVVALEKNPAAVQFLRCKHQMDPSWHHLEDVCGHSVTILSGDGRTLTSDATVLTATQRALLGTVRCVVSELLGSAGDNELSPECIEGTLAELRNIRIDNASGDRSPRHPSKWQSAHVVSIPADVTFVAAPLQSATLAHRIRSLCRPHDMHDHALHTIYVSHMSRAVLLDEPRDVWSFHHARALVADDNAQQSNSAFTSRRHSVVQFTIPKQGRVDVLGGYFRSLLYRSSGGSDLTADVWLSTVPAQWEPVGMYSWFPCVFPTQHAGHSVSGYDVVLVVEVLRDIVAHRGDSNCSVQAGAPNSSAGVFTAWRLSHKHDAANGSSPQQLAECDPGGEWCNRCGTSALVRL